jgi:hypothetical protein
LAASAERDRDASQVARKIYRREYHQKQDRLRDLRWKVGLPAYVRVEIGIRSGLSAAELWYYVATAKMTLQKDLKRLDEEIEIATVDLKRSQHSVDFWRSGLSADNTRRAEAFKQAQEARDRNAARKEVYERERQEKRDALEKLQEKANTKAATARVGEAILKLGEKLPGMASDALGSPLDKIQSGRDQVETFSGLTSALDQHREADLSLTLDEAERNKLEKDLKRLEGDIASSAAQVARYQKLMEEYSWIANTLSTLAAMQNGTWNSGGDRGPTTGPVVSGHSGGSSGGSSSGTKRDGADPTRTGGERAAAKSEGGTTGKPDRSTPDRSTPDRSKPDRSTPDPGGKKGGGGDSGQKGGIAIPRG